LPRDGFLTWCRVVKQNGTKQHTFLNANLIGAQPDNGVRIWRTSIMGLFRFACTPPCDEFLCVA